MADLKISQLGVAAALTGTELVELVQGGANVRSTAQAIANLLDAADVIHPGYISGQWYPMREGLNAAGGGLTALLRIEGNFFLLPRAMTVSELGVRVTTAVAAGNCQLAIYAVDLALGAPTGLPLITSPDLSVATATTVSADIANVTLQPGVYFAAWQSDVTTPVLQGLNAASNQSTFLCGATILANATTSGTNGGIGLRFSTTAYGVWPDRTGLTAQEIATTGYQPFFRAA